MENLEIPERESVASLPQCTSHCTHIFVLLFPDSPMAIMFIVFLHCSGRGVQRYSGKKNGSAIRFGGSHMFYGPMS